MGAYRWYTFGFSLREYLPPHHWYGRFLKLGPVTLTWFEWTNGEYCIELHCMNRLIVAVPDWRLA